jgi:ankyrin repeat protein
MTFHMIPRSLALGVALTVAFMASGQSPPPVPATGAKISAGSTNVLAALPEFTSAIKTGDIARVLQLLDGHPEQINLPTSEQGWTPLQRAIGYGHKKLAKELIQQGADIELADSYGWAPLHYTGLDGDADTASLLMDKGANLNRKGFQGETPLHWAVNNNQVQTAMLLIDRGAQLNALDNLGRTPLDIAIKGNHSRLDEALRKAGGMTARELAETYDWTAPNKTLPMLKSYQRGLTATQAQGHQTESPNKPKAGNK